MRIIRESKEDSRKDPETQRSSGLPFIRCQMFPFCRSSQLRKPIFNPRVNRCFRFFSLGSPGLESRRAGTGVSSVFSPEMLPLAKTGEPYENSRNLQEILFLRVFAASCETVNAIRQRRTQGVPGIHSDHRAHHQASKLYVI